MAARSRYLEAFAPFNEKLTNFPIIVTTTNITTTTIATTTATITTTTDATTQLRLLLVED
jgi:hypothetical protein